MHMWKYMYVHVQYVYIEIPAMPGLISVVHTDVLHNSCMANSSQYKPESCGILEDV